MQEIDMTPHDVSYKTFAAYWIVQVFYFGVNLMKPVKNMRESYFTPKSKER